MKKLIILADWAHDGLTNQEVRTAVEGFMKDATVTPNITFVGATPSTIHTGYLLYQLVSIEERYGRPMDTVFFVNTDPRLQSETGVEKAKGAEFVVLRLKSGIFVCGPNAGYDFSLIKNQIEEVYQYNGLSEGSQFRSRDLYSRVSAHLMDSMEDEMELEEESTNIIPELEGYYIGHIDNFGNVKTTITVEDLKGKYDLGDEISVTINGITKKVLYVSNLFGGTPGALVMYPGSSGDKDNPFIEITVWRHFTQNESTTGIHAFNNPAPGTKIELK